MQTRLLTVLENLRANYWFLPSILTILAVILAVGVVRIDELYGRFYDPLINSLPISRDPAGTREMMSSIAGAIIGVAGVSFSITIVAMTLAAQQYGPRLLDNFLRDRANQFVLGVFVSVPLYCLLVLWSIQDSGNVIFVPQLAVTLGVAAGAFSLGTLIFFIHHIAESIRASQIIDKVADDLDAYIAQLDDAQPGSDFSDVEGDLDEHLPDDVLEMMQPIIAQQSGYVLSVGEDDLLSLATERDLLIKQLYRPGDFVMVGSPLVEVAGDDLDSMDDLTAALNDMFALGNERIQVNDVDFLFYKLSEIAVRSMSPAINDPHTAMMCLDRLGAGLAQVAAKELPSQYRYDDNNELRIIARVITFEALAETAFAQIRHYAARDVTVLQHMLQIIERVAGCTDSNTEREILRHHVELTYQCVQDANQRQWDIRPAERAYDYALAALRGDDTPRIDEDLHV